MEWLIIGGILLLALSKKSGGPPNGTVLPVDIIPSSKAVPRTDYNPSGDGIPSAPLKSNYSLAPTNCGNLRTLFESGALGPLTQQIRDLLLDCYTPSDAYLIGRPSGPYLTQQVYHT